MSTFLQVTSVFVTRENDLAFFCRIFVVYWDFLQVISGNPSYSKQCVVVEGEWVGKASMPNQQECNKYKDIFNSIIYILKTFIYITHM